MAEISKNMKIIIMINIILGIIYAILFLVIPEIFSKLIDSPYFDPFLWRSYGATVLVLCIFGVIALKRNEWENLKILWEFYIVWGIAGLILNIVALIVLSGTASAASIANTVFSIILGIVFTIVNTYFYLQEEK